MDTPPKTDTHKFRSGYTSVKVPAARTAQLEVLKPVTPIERHADCAIIVNHGMGQQVHFETLELVVLALRDAEMRARGQEPSKVKTHIVCLRDRDGKPIQLLRAEMEITDADKRQHSVDVYESYWAPLTEGKVTLRDCIKFLLEGMANGIWYVVRYGCVFDRWLFGGMKKFPIKPLLTALKLMVGLLVLLGPMLLASLLTIPLVGSWFLGRASAPAMIVIHDAKVDLFSTFTPDIVWFEIFLFTYAVAAGVTPIFYRSKFFAGRTGALLLLRGLLKFFAVLISMVGIIGTFFVELRFMHRAWTVFELPHLRFLPLGILAIVLAAALVVGDAVCRFLNWNGFFEGQQDRRKAALRIVATIIFLVASVVSFLTGILILFRASVFLVLPDLPIFPQGTSGLTIVWVVALAAAVVARWFLIEYMGDVAAYLSAHKLSKFDELRDNIRKSVEQVMDAVYRARASKDAPFSYDQVIVVGHSLGSVISYDVLNRMLIDDPDLNVQERTKLLLTFGSPLDKSAFLFRVKGGTDELREAAAANWQPMILQYSFRPEHWINLYSWMDIISGKLRFYDDPKNPENGGTQRIVNRYDLNAILPLAAHTEYWGNQLFGDILYENVASC